MALGAVTRLIVRVGSSIAMKSYEPLVTWNLDRSIGPAYREKRLIAASRPGLARLFLELVFDKQTASTPQSSDGRKPRYRDCWDCSVLVAALPVAAWIY
jgi:hypothetical protein